MKKIALFSTVAVCSVALLVSFSSKKKAEEIAIKPIAKPVVDCAPSEAGVNLITPAEFRKRFGAEPLRTRKNVYSLNQAEINAIKVAVLKMRALPYTDPTSWRYQAAIHGTTMTDNLPSWNTCHKSGEADFFLLWHRMYVYFFERIMRAKSGRANIAQPYWNYQQNAVMPPAYRDNTPSNPLYDGTRSSTINNGGALPSSIMTAFNTSLNNTDFYTFQTNMNNGPHGSVHTTINGNMAVVSSAAQDPVFMLHHGNIDRLWEEWRSRCGGRINPTDATWLNRIYTFFDETGTAVSMRGSDIVEISTQLNYRYDDREPVINCTGARPVARTREVLITKEASLSLAGNNLKANFTGGSATGLETIERTQNRRAFNFDGANVSERLVINFEGVNIQKMPQGVIEVYLNLPAGQRPSANSKYFVGLLDLFSVEHHSAHGTAEEHANGASTEMDATQAAKALGLTLPELRNASISFYVRGASLKGAEVATNAQLSIQRIKFALETQRTQ